MVSESNYRDSTIQGPCYICSDPMVEPMSHEGSGDLHACCRKCLKQWADTCFKYTGEVTCPCCRKEVNMWSLYKDSDFVSNTYKRVVDAVHYAALGALTGVLGTMISEVDEEARLDMTAISLLTITAAVVVDKFCAKRVLTERKARVKEELDTIQLSMNGAHLGDIPSLREKILKIKKEHLKFETKNTKTKPIMAKVYAASMMTITGAAVGGWPLLVTGLGTAALAAFASYHFADMPTTDP